MSATTTRRDVMRRVAIRSVALLAAASLVAACANPTGPSDLTAPTAHGVSTAAQVTGGVGGGSNNHVTTQASSGVGGGSNN